MSKFTDKVKSFVRKEMTPLDRFLMIAFPLYAGLIGALVIVFSHFKDGFDGPIEVLSNPLTRDVLLKRMDVSVTYATYCLGFVLASAGASVNRVLGLLKADRRTILHNIAILLVIIGAWVGIMSWLLVHDGVQSMLRLQQFSGTFLNHHYGRLLLACFMTGMSTLFILSVPPED